MTRQPTHTRTESPPELEESRWLGWYARLGPRVRAGLWLALVCWLAAGALLAGWRPASEDVRQPDAPHEPPADLALMVIEGDPAHRPALALLHRDDAKATVLLLAPGTVVEVPGVGPRTLADALRTSGPDGLAASVANELQVRVPSTLHGTSPEVMALVTAVGGVTVDVPETVEVEQDGRLRRLWTRGPQRMDGESFGRFVTAPVQQESELERLARQDVALRALLAAVRTSTPPPEAALDAWGGNLSGREGLRLIAEVSGSSDLQVLSLPVFRQQLSDQELYGVDADELGPVTTRLEDVRTSRDPRGRRVRLLVGADGAIGPQIARELVEAGFRIEMTQAASRPYDESRVVIPLEERSTMSGTAQRLLDLLGTGKIAYERQGTTLFDATVVVGRDWAEAHGFPQATPTPRPAPRRR